MQCMTTVKYGGKQDINDLVLMICQSGKQTVSNHYYSGFTSHLHGLQYSALLR